MATNYRTGKFGSASFAGTVLTITGWTFTDEADIQDIEDTGGSGFKNRVVGFRAGSGEVTANYREDKAPATATPTLAPGTRGALILEIDANAGTPTINITEVVITSLPLVSEANGTTTFSFAFVTDGDWTELDGGTATNLTF